MDFIGNINNNNVKSNDYLEREYIQVDGNGWPLIFKGEDIV